MRIAKPALFGGTRVNGHQNARTNPYSRALLVARIESGWTAATAAASFGVSVRTVPKWRARERAERLAGLADRSSRPHHSAGRMGESWRKMILRLRHCRLTAAEIACRLGLARSTVATELARLAFGWLAASNPRLPSGVTNGAAPAISSISTSRSSPASTSPPPRHGQPGQPE
ncbi:MAG: leucine zipper domain-containing protein [Geminicoccaceae bacterium]